MTSAVWQQRPESVGYVHARSSDPFQDPNVTQTTRKTPASAGSPWGMRLARRLLKKPELARVL